MAHQELALIAKILDTGELPVVEAEGVVLDHFKTNDGFMLYKYILRYYQDKRTSGNVPTREMVEKKFPTINLPKPDRLDTKSVLAEFLDYYIKEELRALADRIMELSHKPDECLGELQVAVSDLTRDRRSAQDVIVSQSLETIRQRYETNRDRGSLRGIPYPWDVLNAETTGMINGEFILLYGRPKSMKTWVLLKIATHAYDRASRRVLVYTREMTLEQMMDRSICLLIGAPYSAFKKGKLREIEVPEGGTMEDRFQTFLDTMYQDEETCTLETGYNKSLIITSDRDYRGGGGGARGLYEKIKDHRADLVCVDAMYLMKNDRKNTRSIKWDDQSDITQDVKDVALELNKPLIGTTQANRPSEDARGGSMRNIAFADAYGMNCDLALEINKKSTPDPEVNEIALAITGAREINMTGFAIHGCAAADFGCMMQKVVNDKGVVQVDDEGNTLVEPIVFYENRDIKAFFKDADDESDRHKPERLRPQRPKAEMVGWAKEMLQKGRRA